jgi:hypothetical protein|tara:strand:+ start:212 stop:442 length:231 start_codon:yes stop_codon:yes gene_type:complete
MKEQSEKQILEWREELRTHKERLQQAEAVVEQETKLIAMIEGGIQFGENLLKNAQVAQQSDKVESKKESKTEQPSS